MSILSIGRLALSLGQHVAPVRVTLRLGAAGWAAAACVWCVAVGAIGILGHGMAAGLALGALLASALAATVLRAVGGAA